MTHKPFSTEKVLAMPLLSKLKCTPVCLSRLFSHYYSIYFFCIKTFRCMVKRQTSQVHYNCSLLVLLYTFFWLLLFSCLLLFTGEDREKNIANGCICVSHGVKRIAVVSLFIVFGAALVLLRRYEGSRYALDSGNLLFSRAFVIFRY